MDIKLCVRWSRLEQERTEGTEIRIVSPDGEPAFVRQSQRDCVNQRKGCPPSAVASKSASLGDRCYGGRARNELSWVVVKPIPQPQSGCGRTDFDPYTGVHVTLAATTLGLYFLRDVFPG